MLLNFCIIMFIVLLDQLTKGLCRAYLKNTESGTIPVIKNVFHITYVENRGAAFSILQNQRWLFIAITIVISCVMFYYLLHMRKRHDVLTISICLILGGAIGNLIDRIWRGYVVDFFDFRLINFAVFNIADSAVVVGAILFCAYLIFSDDKTILGK